VHYYIPTFVLRNGNSSSGNILNLHPPRLFVAAQLDICAASQKYSGVRLVTKEEQRSGYSQAQA
jgi:hypothetical protein